MISSGTHISWSKPLEGYSQRHDKKLHLASLFQVIDPIAPRYTALELNPVSVYLHGNDSSAITVPLHPKNPDVGSKTVHVSNKMLIDQVDAKALKEGENATFVHYGNVMIDKVHK